MLSNLIRWPWGRYAPHAIVVLFFVVSARAFHSDFNQISFDVLVTSKGILFSVCGLSLTSYVIRGLRWRLMLAQIGYRLPLAFSLITYVAGFAFTLAPGKVGELAKYAYYRDYRIPMSPVAGAYSVERIADLAIFVTLAFVFFGTASEEYGSILIGAGLCVPMGMLLLAGIPEHRLAQLERYLIGSGTGRVKVVRGVLAGLSAAKELMSIRAISYSLLLGFAGWLAESLGLYLLCSLSPATSIGVGEAVGIYATAIVVGAISLLPGGLGTTEAALAAILASRGMPFSDVLLVTILCRVLTLWLAVVLGWVAVGYLKATTKRRSEIKNTSGGDLA